MQNLWLLIATLAGCLLASPLWAADDITRNQAVQRALENNPGLQATAQIVKGARARRLQADGFEPPSVFWDFEEADSPRPSRAGNQIFGVEQSFDWPGVRQARKAAADFGIDAASAKLGRERLRLTARVQKIFDKALLTKAETQLLKRLVDLMNDAVDITRVRMKSGTGQYGDLLRVRIARQRLQNDFQVATTAANTTRRQLANLLGIFNELPAISGDLDYKPIPVDRETLITRISEQGPTALLMRHRAQQAGSRVQAARQGRFPEITVGLGRQRLFNGMTTDYTWAGQLRLKMPLPGSDRQNGLEDEAIAALHQTRNRAQDLRIQTVAQVQQRFDEAETLSEQIRNFKEAILPDAEDQLKAAQQDYRVRRIDALNLVDVYNTFLDTRRSYLGTLTQYRAAVTDLQTGGEDLWELSL